MQALIETPAPTRRFDKDFLQKQVREDSPPLSRHHGEETIVCRFPEQSLHREHEASAALGC